MAGVLAAVWAYRWYWVNCGWGFPALSCPYYWSCRSSQCLDRPESGSACSSYSLVMSPYENIIPFWSSHAYRFYLNLTSIHPNCVSNPINKQQHTHLLGDGGVWRDMVGTPVVGVIWLGSCVPCVRFRFNWGVLFPMPLTGKPIAPAEKHKHKGRTTNAVRQPRGYSFCFMSNQHPRNGTNSRSLCGPYKLAPSCDSWPDDDGDGEDSIWKKTFNLPDELNKLMQERK